MVLFHCCMSLEHAEQVVREGFESETFLSVTTMSPYLNGNIKHEHVVVVLGVRSTSSFPTTTST